MNLREYLGSPRGRMVAAGVLLSLICVAAFAAWRSVTSNSAADASADRLFICAETGKSFRVTLKAGASIPVYSPYSKKETGYPAERCFWTAEGGVKREPTAVLLKRYQGEEGRTFCPDCGRLVVIHNPYPNAHLAPPPTEAEYAARREER